VFKEEKGRKRKLSGKDVVGPRAVQRGKRRKSHDIVLGNAPVKLLRRLSVKVRILKIKKCILDRLYDWGRLYT